MAGFRDRVHLATPVTRLQPAEEGVQLHTASGEAVFDQVILACHSDQALALLADPSATELEVLSAIRYQANDVVLHTDQSLLPSNRRAWASWNYRMDGDRDGLPRVSYDMNRLMGIQSRYRFLVSLNDTAAISPDLVLQRFEYAHPVFTPAGARAQQRWDDINGQRGLWFCGAWWGKGFHEDGVNSALRVVDAMRRMTHSA
jgi:predicted NAD/FAD-binding protein